MKVLVVGCGSIGRRHVEIFSKMKDVQQVDIVTRQVVQGFKTYQHLDELSLEQLHQYNYFVIASATAKHYDQLRYLCQYVSNKKILVEKPLTDQLHAQQISLNKNHVFVAYNLRFHSALQKIKELLTNSKPLLVNVICGQYLPQWRPETDYRVSYSANINQGGGVLRDLSHELDYCAWLFGNFREIKSINKKISSLEINSDDIFMCIGMTNQNVAIGISLDYLSQKPIRQLLIHCERMTIVADLINAVVEITREGNQKETFSFQMTRNATYEGMHRALIQNNFQNLCTYEEGLNTVAFIERCSMKIKDV